MDWKLDVNLFETTTRRRFPAMHSLIEHHWARCKTAAGRTPGDVDYAVMLARVEGARTAWLNAYTAWKMARAAHKSRTQRMNTLIAELRGKHIATWDTMVSATDALQGTWLNGSAGHESIFPGGRRPFQQGGMDARISAVAALAGALAAVPVLNTVAGLVSAFHSVIRTARDEQQQAEARVEACSAALEAQRRAAATVLYRNLARLMEKFAESPAMIYTFYDLQEVKSAGRRTRGIPDLAN